MLVKRSLSPRFCPTIYLSLFIHDNISYRQASNLMSQYKKAKLLVKQILTRLSVPCGTLIEADSDAEQTVERYQSFVSEWKRLLPIALNDSTAESGLFTNDPRRNDQNVRKVESAALPRPHGCHVTGRCEKSRQTLLIVMITCGE